jgi:hypothetical protein
MEIIGFDLEIRVADMQMNGQTDLTCLYFLQ